MSVAIGASAAGARAYTATASQGLLYMAEARLQRRRASGLPIVMTVANRAIGAPINIWNDHSDSMSQRDCGWIQLYAETNQEALDLHIQAFRLAEELSTAGDGLHGRLHPHARRTRRSRCPTQEQVDAFLPPFEPRQVLDPDDPVTIGAMVGPEAFMEVKYLQHAKQMRRARPDPARSPPTSSSAFGRSSGGLRAALPHRGRRDDRRRARLGARARSRRSSTSCARTAMQIGALGDQLFRPFPLEEVRAALEHARARRRAREGARRRHRRHRRRQDVRMALSGLKLHGSTVDRRARRARDHAGVAAHAVRTTRTPTAWSR